MQPVIAFDVYGTLIDTHGIFTAVQKLIPAEARHFVRTWRDKQLEYSLRRAFMQKYADFDVCTKQALDYACAYHRAHLTDASKSHLLERYRLLPAFSDVRAGLNRLKTAGFSLYAFSNGTKKSLEMLLNNAGIGVFFRDMVSVDDMETFKPSPDAYGHFLREAKAAGGCAWLVSSNPFDVIGSVSAGMKAAWVQRTPECIFDPWGIEPTAIVNSLTELPDKVFKARSCTP